MLDSLRKRSRDSVTLKVVFGAIVVVFVFWGIGTIGFEEREIAARVNEQIISAKDFERAYRNLAETYRDLSSAQLPDEFLRRQALEQLVVTELLVQEADRLDLQVDTSELRDSIAQIPAFQVDGRFNKDLYLRALQANGLKPADFEALQRRQLLITKVQDLVRAGVHVTDAELRDVYDFENSRVGLRFLRVSAAKFVDEITLSDEDVQAFFAEKNERFREPERVRISYLEFTPEFFREQVQPTEEDLRDYYQVHAEEYRRPEEVRVRQILLERPAGATEEQREELRRRAAEILVKARAGEDFAALATENSDDASAAAGGDLGFVGRGVLKTPVEEAVFALEPGTIGELVETDSGIHILKVEEKKAEEIEPLDAVREGLTAAVRDQRARGLALERAEEAHQRLLDGVPLETVATDLGLTVQVPSPFAKSEPIGALGPSPEVLEAAFATAANEAGEIVTLGSGYLLFRVTERIASHVPELAEIRSAVESALRAERASQAAKTKAEELLERLKAEGAPSIASLAEGEGLSVEESGEIARLGPYIPNLGNQPELKQEAFRLTPEAPIAPAVYDVSGDSVIAVLTERIPADAARFEDEREALAQRVRQEAESSTVQEFVDELKKKAEVAIGQGYGDGGLS